MSTETHSDIDKSVKLPKAVRDAAARSEAIFNEVNGVKTPEQLAEEAAAAGAAAGAAEAGAESPIKPETPPAAGQEPEDDTGNWEHRYNSMKGRYNRATEQIRGLSERLDGMQTLIATLQTAPAPAPKTPAATPELKLEDVLTEDEVRDYGDDFLKVVEKKAKAAMAPVLHAYEQQIEDLKSQIKGVSSVVEQDTKTKMHSVLDAKIPDWREINTDPQFISWLSLPDTYSGAIRQTLLSAAYAQGDALRVAAFFNGFLTEEAAVAPVPRGEPAQGVKAPKIPLASLAAPGRAKSAASTELPAEKPIFTRAQITAFYSDVAAGKWRGRDADKVKQEREIILASQEGRIR